VAVSTGALDMVFSPSLLTTLLYPVPPLSFLPSCSSGKER